MDKKVEILLGSEKNIDSVNVDTYNKIELTRNTSEINEFTVNDAVNSTEVFDEERNANPVYRISGKIEYLSLLNGLINNYKYLEDFFNPVYGSASKNLLNSFDFYLVRPAESGYTNTGDGEYTRFFKVVATPSYFEQYNAGFSNNVYGEQTYCFNFKTDFDVSTYFDNFGFPITELFLYAQYNLKQNGNGVNETMRYTRWTPSGSKITSNFIPTTLEVGDYIETINGVNIGQAIEYDQEEFTQTKVTDQTIYVYTSYLTDDDITTKNLIWEFNPFIPFTLRYFSDTKSNANSGDTSYEIVDSIPDYATLLDDDGNYVWREILEQGHTEPLTGVGVDYPFINGRRYLFDNVVFNVSPDLSSSNSNTSIVFNEIAYSDDATNIDTTPLTPLDDIEKPCK